MDLYLTQNAEDFRKSLKFTEVVAQPDGSYTVTILRWGVDVSETHLSALPFNTRSGYVPYGKFLPWNAWLGETLMYSASKTYLSLVKEEIDELTKIANTGALTPGLLKTAAVPYAIANEGCPELTVSA